MNRSQFLIAFACAPAVIQAAEISFNRDIRPILTENCYACHGPDQNHRKGDLRLDVRDAAIEAKAITPGKPDTSSVIERILTSNADDLMPLPTPTKNSPLRRRTCFAAGSLRVPSIKATGPSSNPNAHPSPRSSNPPILSAIRSMPSSSSDSPKKNGPPLLRPIPEL